MFNRLRRKFSKFLLFAVMLATAQVAQAAQDGEQPATPVEVDAVIQEPLHQTVPVIGRLVATRSGVVAARTNGPIASFMVQVGDRVSAGDVMRAGSG